MTNPINPFNRSVTNSVNNHADKAKTSTPAEQSNTTSTGSSNDKVSLSQESKQVSSLQKILKDSSGIDQVKVDSIKQEIANGNYPLDAEKTAANFINLEQSLLE